MAFDLSKFGRSTAAYNSSSNFNYVSTADAVAAIQAADYFLPVIDTLKVNDWIHANGTDGPTILNVATLDKATPTITVTVVA